MYKCIFSHFICCNRHIGLYIYLHTRTCLYHCLEKELCLYMFSHNYECKVCKHIQKQTLIHAYIDIHTYLKIKYSNA